MKLPSILEQAEERGIALGRTEVLRSMMDKLISIGQDPAEAAKSIGLS